MLKVQPQHLLRRGHTKRFKYDPYNVGSTFAQRQNDFKIFLNATVGLNLAGDVILPTLFLKKATHFRAISFCGVLSPPCIISCHPLKVILPIYSLLQGLIVKLTILDNTIYQSMCKSIYYILPKYRMLLLGTIRI